MNELPHVPYSGYLFAWEEGPDIPPLDWYKLESTAVFAHPGMKQCSILHYTTRDKWLEDPVLAGEDFQYTYLLCRSSVPNHAVLLGHSAHLVDRFVEAVGLHRFVFSPAVHVEDIVTLFMEPGEAPPPPYLLSNIFAKVEGYGQSLRTVAFWGADLGDATHFFNEHIRKKTTAFRIEIRDVETGHPVMSMGSRGEVNFTYAGVESLKDLMKAIKFFADHKMIQWPAS